MRIRHAIVLSAALALELAPGARAQGEYEIQVYASETMDVGRTIVELHSNYTARGETRSQNRVFPSDHALHETLEVTHGFTPWFETGFYLFSSVQPGAGWEWVGDNVRPRVRVPEAWQWPVGLSLSMEIGYQRRAFSEDTWSMELRPIIDKEFGPFYLSLNPVLEKSLHGDHAGEAPVFAPAAKACVEVIPQMALGFEYYSSLGRITHFDSWHQQEHQLFPVVDLFLHPDLEFNFGVGFGLTDATDDLVWKLILGWRF